MADGQNIVEQALNLYVVEYSAEQKQIHIAQLGAVLKANRETSNNIGGGYVPLSIFATYEEASEHANKLREESPERLLLTPEEDGVDDEYPVARALEAGTGER